MSLGPLRGAAAVAGEAHAPAVVEGSGDARAPAKSSRADGDLRAADDGRRRGERQELDAARARSAAEMRRAGVDAAQDLARGEGEPEVEVARRAALAVGDDRPWWKPDAASAQPATSRGAVGRAAVDDEHLEALERVVLGGDGLEAAARCRPPRSGRDDARVTSGSRSSSRPSLPSTLRTVRPTMRTSRRRLWWRRYQNSYWSFSSASLLAAGVAVLHLGPAGEAGAHEVAQVVERQLLAELVDVVRLLGRGPTIDEVAPQDVDHLRQLVEVASLRSTRPNGVIRGVVLGGPLVAGAPASPGVIVRNLRIVKRAAALADPRLAVEQRATVGDAVPDDTRTGSRAPSATSAGQRRRRTSSIRLTRP